MDISMLLRKGFKMACKQDHALNITSVDNNLLINGFISIRKDSDGEYSLEYEKGGDIYMDGPNSTAEMVDKVVGVLMDRISYESKPKKKVPKIKVAVVGH